MAANENLDDTLPPNEVATELCAGAIFDSNYQIIAKLGRGSLGVVYKAKQLTLNRNVALKLVHKHLSGIGVVIDAFKQEAHTIAKVKHPNIVEVYGFGIANGQAYLVSEYIEGISLGSLLERKRMIIKGNLVPILCEICDALTHAHNNGVVHGDLKPSNISMIGAVKQEVKLMDFGISYHLSKSGLQLQNLNDTESIEGTVAYTSPEQCKGQAPDARSDIYSLACIAYEILCGHPPFTEAPYQIVHDHINTPPQRTADMENDLGSIVIWALQKEPGKRPQSADEFKQALIAPEQFLNTDKMLSSGRVAPENSAAPQRHKLFIGATILLVLLGAAVMSYICLSKQSDEESLSRVLQQEDSQAIIKLIEAEKSNVSRASNLLGTIIKSPRFKAWSPDKRMDLLEELLKFFIESKNAKGASLAANALYAELIQQGAACLDEHRKPAKQWQERFENICNYLIANENSRYAWHQIFFINEIARNERNRRLIEFLDSKRARLSFLDLRATASVYDAAEGHKGYGRAGDIYTDAANYCWLHDMKDKYEEYMQKTAMVCKKYKMSAEVSLHIFRAREYLNLNNKQLAARELQLAAKTTNDLVLDRIPYEKLEQELQSRLNQKE